MQFYSFGCFLELLKTKMKTLTPTGTFLCLSTTTISCAEDVEAAVGRPLHMDELSLCVRRDGKLTLGVRGTVAKSPTLQLGPLKLSFNSKGDTGGELWVMHRVGLSSAFRRPRFSNFLGAYRHLGPDGIEHTLVRVHWRREAVDAYHPKIKAPLALEARDMNLPRFCLAEHVVPHPCFGMRDPYDASQVVMLTEKRWHVLRHLGFPPII